MDMKAVVCERWLVPLPPDGSAVYADRVRKGAVRRSAGITAGYWAFRALEPLHAQAPFRSAVEYFGGMGCQTLVIGSLFAPPEHVVMELEPGTAAHLGRLFTCRGVTVCQADAYALDSHTPAQLVALDFGDLTAHRLRPGQSHRILLDRVVVGGPRAIVLTDVAAPRLHLHRDRYAQALGSLFYTYEEYLQGLDGWLRRTLGYQMLRCWYTPWSAKMALVPDQGTEADIAPVLARPRGLELR